MTANFFLKGVTVRATDHRDGDDTSTIVSLREYDGGHLCLVVNTHNAADALAMADALRAAALKHMPASEPVAVEV